MVAPKSSNHDFKTMLQDSWSSTADEPWETSYTYTLHLGAKESRERLHGSPPHPLGSRPQLRTGTVLLSADGLHLCSGRVTNSHSPNVNPTRCKIVYKR